MSLKIPLVGQLLLQSILSRFFYSLAICTTAALPFIEALDGVKTITKNTLFKETIHSIKKEVYAGFSFHFSIKKTLFFPSKALEMIAIGEESGTLEQMLYTLAEYYEEAVDTRIERLSCLLEPFIMIILGLILGCLIVGIYLPIFKLGTLI